MRACFVAAATLILVCAVGCRDRDGTPEPTGAEPTGAGPALASPTSSAPPTTGTTPTPTPEPGPREPRLSTACGMETGLPAEIQPGSVKERTLQSGGIWRSYRLYVPLGVSLETPVSVVLNWHGRGSSAIAQEIYSGMTPLADREGFILVSPEGVGRQFLTVAGVDDVQFARDLVERLAGEFCLDLGKVFSTGMSNGGFMSTQLACRAPDLVAAVAPVTGQTPASNCVGGGVPTLGFFGMDDQVVPFGPGLILGAVPYQGTEAAMADWAVQNGCAGEYVETQVSEHVVLREWQGCRAYTAYYAVEGGGHTWPGAGLNVPGLGATTQEISATELIWEFFAGTD